MSDAIKKIHASDNISSAVQSAIDQYNESFCLFPPNAWGAVPQTLGFSSGTFKLLAFAPEHDIVIKDVLFSANRSLVNQNSQLEVYAYNSYDYAIPSGGITKCYLAGFNVHGVQIQHVHKLSEQQANIKTGGFPFVLKRGQFLVMRMKNKELPGGAITTFTQVVGYNLKDKLEFSPVQPSGRFSQTIRTT
jgi:hypothetical protein